jgi:hypothetical protein
LAWVLNFQLKRSGTGREKLMMNKLKKRKWSVFRLMYRNKWRKNNRVRNRLNHYTTWSIIGSCTYFSVLLHFSFKYGASNNPWILALNGNCTGYNFCFQSWSLDRLCMQLCDKCLLKSQLQHMYKIIFFYYNIVLEITIYLQCTVTNLHYITLNNRHVNSCHILVEINYLTDGTM